MTLGDMDLTRMRSVFGTDLASIDSYLLLKTADEYLVDSEAYQKGYARVAQLVKNPLSEERMDKVVRLYLAMKEYTNTYQADAITLKCHFALSQVAGFTPCVPLSVIGNEMVASCEADIPLVLTQLLMYYLSGGETTTYADSHELTGERILWGACGFAPAAMCVGGKIVCDSLEETPSGLGATFGDYLTNRNCLKAGPMTVARILKEADGSFTIHSASGQAVGDIGKTSELGAPQYAFTEWIIDSDFDGFAQNMGSHHYALVYADLKEELALYGKYAGIKALIEG